MAECVNQKYFSSKDELATMKTQLNDYEEKTKEFEQQLQKQKRKLRHNKYVDLSQQYHQLKDTAHEETLTLDRLKTRNTYKSEHEEFEFEKNDGYQSEKSSYIKATTIAFI